MNLYKTLYEPIKTMLIELDTAFGSASFLKIELVQGLSILEVIAQGFTIFFLVWVILTAFRLFKNFLLPLFKTLRGDV